MYGEIVSLYEIAVHFLRIASVHRAGGASRRPYGFLLTSLWKKGGGPLAVEGSIPQSWPRGGSAMTAPFSKGSLEAVGADAFIGPQTCDPVHAYQNAKMFPPAVGEGLAPPAR